MISSTENLKKTYSEFVTLLQNNKKTIVLDIKDDISKGIVKNSIYIAFNDKFNVLLPGVVNLESPLLIVADLTKLSEILQAIQTCGFLNIVGYLEGGFQDWLKNKGETSHFSSIETEKFKDLYELKTEELHILDVRNKPELETGVLPNAILVNLKELEQQIINGKLEALKNKNVYVYCGLGPRSMIGSSILKKYGFNKVTYIVGGSKKMVETGLEMKKAKI